MSLVPEDLPVYVPTYQRPHVTLARDMLAAAGFKHVVGVVRKSERASYAGVYDRIVTVPDTVRGIGDTRQVILDQNQYEVFAMCDDDLKRFSFKPDVSAYGGLRPATPRDVMQCVSEMLRLGGRHFAGSIVGRFYTAPPSRVRWQQWGMHNCFLVMTSSVRRNVRFDRLQLLEDTDYSLQVAQAGVPVLISKFMCHEKGALATGGCDEARSRSATWRTDALAEIKRLHPKYVTLLGDGSKSRIAWKQARDSGMGQGA